MTRMPIIFGPADLPAETLEMLLAHARQETLRCPQVCNDFKVYSNPFAPRNLFVRYLETHVHGDDVDNIERREQWLCFQSDGTPLDCQIIFGPPASEARLKAAMILLYETIW